jgi:hypothetical protein
MVTDFRGNKKDTSDQETVPQTEEEFVIDVYLRDKKTPVQDVVAEV